MPPASARLVSELVTLSPWLSMTLIWMPRIAGSWRIASTYLSALPDTSNRFASRS
jgi:hypothetical protein